MAYWEFLLQKEGDRDWLPLETAHVEISEGRYRIVAHTSYSNASAEIRLSQLLTDQIPPQRKVLKRTDRTTNDGLMMVIPFTHLTAGRWTIQCSSTDGLGDALSTGWQYQIQIQVLAIDSDLDYWDSDLEEPDGKGPFSAQTVEAFDTPLPDNPAFSVTEPTAPPQLQESAAIEDLPLRLQLAQQAIVLQDQAICPLQGHITTLSDIEGVPREGRLWVQFRDPETSQVLHREAYPLVISALPCHFTISVSLPENLSVRLLVGEMSLWSAATPPQILAIQGLTVTLNLDALLEAVAEQGDILSETLLDNPAGSPQTEIAPPPREVPFRRLYLPTTGLTLPPAIHRSKGQTMPPCLPQIPGYPATSRPETLEKATDANPSSAVSKQAAKTVDLPAFPRPTVETPGTLAEVTRSLESETTPSVLPPTNQEPVPPPEAAPQTDSTPDFQGRFWSRLNSLAHTSTETAAALKAEMEAAGLRSENSVLTPVIPVEGPGSSELPNQPETQGFTPKPDYEVVVYEADIEEDPSQLLLTAQRRSLQSGAEPAISPEDAYDDIPPPQIKLPEPPLIAGTLLSVTVNLPAYPQRLAVKIWIVDVQTRSLVDKPRWLMNWTPNEAGEHTTSLRLQVPQGSIEARFEAIAIDLTTQRESRKTTLLRQIVPPDEPSTSPLMML